MGTFTGNKDVDHIILSKLNGADCISLFSVNHYLNTLDNDKFWKQKTVLKLGKYLIYNNGCVYTFQGGKDKGRKCARFGWGCISDDKYYCEWCMKHSVLQKTFRYILMPRAFSLPSGYIDWKRVCFQSKK